MRFLARLKHYSFSRAQGLFLTVFVFRLICLARFSASPLLLPRRGDMHFYHDWALRILAGQWTDHLAFYGLPLYAYLLALLYKVFGTSPFIPALLQTAFDAATAVIIYQLALLIAPLTDNPDKSDRATRFGLLGATHIREIFALTAALGWAFFVPAEAYSIILMPTALMVFVFWFVVRRIAERDATPPPNECFWLGLLIGFTSMGIATLLFLVPFIGVAIFIKHSPASENVSPRKRKTIASILLLVGVTLGTSPCWIHNSIIARDPVMLSAHSGINFWIGNNPTANGYPRFPPGLRAGQAAMLEDSISAAEAAAGHSLKRGEVSQYWSARAKNYIREHPGEWIHLLGQKFRNIWNAFQYDDLSVITILREHEVIFPGVYFGLIAALGLPGLILAIIKTPKSRWIAFAIALQVVALLPVFVTERYRLPIVPGLLVFCGSGLLALWSACAHRNFGVIGIYLGVLCLAMTFVSSPQRNASLWALDAYNAGWQALDSGNLPLAEEKLSVARAYVPKNAETNFAFGNLRVAQGSSNAARAFYFETLQIEPTHKGALNNLGVLALDANDPGRARIFFERALEQDRHSPKTHFLLAKAAFAQGDMPVASREINQAVALSPSQSEFLELRSEITNRISR